MSPPTVSAIMTVYNAEQYIGESVSAILSQTRPPEEIVVIDDGSTDGTPGELERFYREIRVVRQPNSGHANALNLGFREARCDYVAKCDADDIWQPNRLACQLEAIERSPEIDITFGAARVFGAADGQWAMPHERDPSVGILDRRRFGRTLYRTNPICPSSTLIRRELYEQLGPFAEDLAAEDYDYWMRALRAGAVFHYEPSELVNHRRHESNVSSNKLAMSRTNFFVHSRDSDLIDSRSLVRKVIAHDLFVIGRLLRDQGHPREARSAFLSSLCRWPTMRGIAWTVLLSIPGRYRRTGIASTKNMLLP